MVEISTGRVKLRKGATMRVTRVAPRWGQCRRLSFNLTECNCVTSSPRPQRDLHIFYPSIPYSLSIQYPSSFIIHSPSTCHLSILLHDTLNHPLTITHHLPPIHYLFTVYPSTIHLLRIHFRRCSYLSFTHHPPIYHLIVIYPSRIHPFILPTIHLLSTLPRYTTHYPST